MTNPDFVIVGAGVLGIFHTWHLANHGHSVLLLERDSKPRGSSIQNFGIAAFDALAPRTGLIRQYAESTRQTYQQIKDRFDLPSIRRGGSLCLASTDIESQVLKELHSSLAQDGKNASLLDADQVLEFQPAIREDYAISGLYFPNDLSVDPPQFNVDLLNRLSEFPNVEVRFQTTATEVTDGPGGVCVQINGNELLSCNRVLICSGYETQTLFPEFFEQQDLELVKLQMYRTKPVIGPQIQPSLMSGLSIARYPAFEETDSFADLIQQPLDPLANQYGIHILIKQNEDGSLIIGDSHEHYPAGSMNSVPSHFHTEIEQFIFDYAAKMLDVGPLEIDQQWNGYYLSSSSGLINRWISDHVKVVTGIGGKGMTLGAGLSEANVSELVA